MLVSIVRNSCRNGSLRSSFNVQRFEIYRSFRTDSRTSRISQKRVSLREKLMQPATETPFNIGNGALIGGSVVGIGALCYYGLGLSNEVGAVEKSYLWSQNVRDRISTTYSYFGGSLLITAASAVSAFRSPALMNIVARPGLMGLIGCVVVSFGSLMLVHNIPYKEGFGPKQMAWIFQSSVMGVMLAPLCFVGGPILVRAALYTAGIFGGLSTIAVCAPSEKYLMLGGPLAMGLGAVFVSSLGSMFLPPTTALGASLYSFSLYGGLLLFSALVLYDTQKIIKHAEHEMIPFDPINHSLSIYMDAMNIFIRLVSILTGGNRKK
uniref:Growth hormone-inducible transmembrane protein n=1 Tax=Cuerna arida TaxID=1464854 RepID=A0A1B6F2B1_9HEMI